MLPHRKIYGRNRNRLRTVVYLSLSSRPRRPCAQPCPKGTNVSIAKSLPAVASRRHAITGGQRTMSRIHARVSVARDADANNVENQCRVLADCEQVFEDVGAGPLGTGRS